jgi:hypothetical protein
MTTLKLYPRLNQTDDDIETVPKAQPNRWRHWNCTQGSTKQMTTLKLYPRLNQTDDDIETVPKAQPTEFFPDAI